MPLYLRSPGSSKYSHYSVIGIKNWFCFRQKKLPNTGLDRKLEGKKYLNNRNVLAFCNAEDPGQKITIGTKSTRKRARI